MKKLNFFGLAICLSAMAVNAQDTNHVEQLKKTLQNMQENFEKVQHEQHQQIEALTKKLDELTRTPAVSSPPGETKAPEQKSAEQKKLEQELAAELGPTATNAPPTAQSSGPTKAWSPAQPMTV